MSNLGPMGGQQRLSAPTPPQGEAIGRYATYAEAQRAVDFLSDEHFPVQNVTIVGNNLQMVERVTGRLTYGRAAGAGAASGAWFGLLIGLMLSVFGNGGTAGLLTGLLIGAGFGMLFAVISYALTGGRRDFTSASQIVAGEYVVLCMPQMSGQARQVLSKLPNGFGRGAGPQQGAWGAPPPAPGSHAAGGGQGPWGAPDPSSRAGAPQGWMPPPQPGTGPAAPPPPPAGQRPADGPAEQEQAPAEPDLSGPTYAEKVEEQRRARREAERRALDEDARREGPGEDAAR
ncbi:YflT domain-containing protein [Kineococcus arenarius]|uniref:general stress protein n=1 Tax=Kineococcus sp. SYSU DK007 TaxID=3383128 RepID=UPI003D7E44F7